MSRELGDRMVSDERFKLLTFTGSPSVGWRMKERAGKKKVVLELGGNAGVIVDKSAGPRLGRQALPVGAFAYAGQVCISVQRMFVHEDIWDAFMSKFVAGARALKVGDPLDPQTDVGPMVDEHAASRTQRWVDEALAAGGKALLGGTADGTFFPPTILDRRPDHGPGLLERGVRPARRRLPVHATSSEAIRQVNDSMFGLQTGVFTNDLGAAWRAFNELEVGGVIVNDVPDLPDRPHALRRRQGLGPRARGPALGDRGHDRAPDHGPRLAELMEVPPVFPFDMFGGGFGLFFIVSAVFSLAITIGIIVLIVLGIRWLIRNGETRGGGLPGAMPGDDTALDLLRQRYARGEIDVHEFEERKRTLGG